MGSQIWRPDAGHYRPTCRSCPSETRLIGSLALSEGIDLLGGPFHPPSDHHFQRREPRRPDALSRLAVRMRRYTALCRWAPANEHRIPRAQHYANAGSQRLRPLLQLAESRVDQSNTASLRSSRRLRRIPTRYLLDGGLFSASFRPEHGQPYKTAILSGSR